MDTLKLPDGTAPVIYFVDLDGTLLSTSSEKYFLKHLVNRGILSPSRFMIFLLHYILHPVRTIREGKGWNRSYLSGIPTETVMREAEICAKELLKSNIRSWTLQSIHELKAAGCRIVLLSASLEYIVNGIAKELPVDEICASEPLMVNNRFTGELAGIRPWGKNKMKLAVDICTRYDTELDRCAAAGDSWADRFIMEKSGCSFAVCPDRKLNKLAARKNWPAVKGRHTRWA